MFNEFEVIPLRRSQGRQNAHIKGCAAGGLAKKEAAANSCKLARPKRCKKVCVVAKRRRPSLLANSSTSLRSRSVTTRPRLSASKRWSISAWLIGCSWEKKATSAAGGFQRPCEDAPKGMEFLYNRNRFNVATSRARCACIVVGSPRLFSPECRTPRQMELANVLCRYAEMGEPVALGPQVPVAGGNALFPHTSL
jgi:hypothetical protein